MAINDAFLSDLKARTDIMDLVSSYVSLDSGACTSLKKPSAARIDDIRLPLSYAVCASSIASSSLPCL